MSESKLTQETFSISSDAPGFAPVALRLLDDDRITDPTTIAVYAALASFINYGTGDCWPSHSTIGKRARCARVAVLRHIETLCRLGYVQKKASGASAGKTNNYHLVDAWGRQGVLPVEQGYATGGIGGASPVEHERDSLDETQEKERDSLPSVSLQEEDPQEDAKEETQTFRERLQAVALEVLNAETPHVSKAETLLLRGEDPDTILAAWTVMLRTRPAGAAYFDKDYATSWKPKARKLLKERAESKPILPERDLMAELRKEREKGDTPEGRATIADLAASVPWRRAGSGGEGGPRPERVAARVAPDPRGAAV